MYPDLAARGVGGAAGLARCRSPSAPWSASSTSTPASSCSSWGATTAWPGPRSRCSSGGGPRPWASSSPTPTPICWPSGWGCGSASPPGPTTPTTSSGETAASCRWGCAASRQPREHWESTLGVRQFWAEEIAALGRRPPPWTQIVRAPARAGASSRSISPTTSTPPTPAWRPRPARPSRAACSPDSSARSCGGWGGSSTWWGPTSWRWRPPIGSPEQSRRTVAVGRAIPAGEPGRPAREERPS